jgi:hypothetical protein
MNGTASGNRIRHHRDIAVIGLLVALAIFAAAPARADQLHLLINGKAIHFSPPRGSDFNERNWGFGLQYDFAPVRERWVPFLTASGFRDSFKNPSYYAGGGFLRRSVIAPSLDDLHFEWGLVAFLMTREDHKDNRPFFGVLPAFSLGTDRIAINMSYVPKVHPKMTNLIFFQLKLRLGEF